jgi:hypothetical protein
VTLPLPLRTSISVRSRKTECPRASIADERSTLSCGRCVVVLSAPAPLKPARSRTRVILDRAALKYRGAGLHRLAQNVGPQELADTLWRWPGSNRAQDFAREPASPTRAMADWASAGVFSAALLLTLGFRLRRCRQREHCRALTDVEPRQRLHLAIGRRCRRAKRRSARATTTGRRPRVSVLTSRAISAHGCRRRRGRSTAKRPVSPTGARCFFLPSLGTVARYFDADTVPKAAGGVPLRPQVRKSPAVAATSG